MKPNEPLIRGALHLAAPDSGASTEKAKGVIIGVVSTLMDTFCWDWETAFRYVLNKLPDNYRPECIPQSWAEGESS